MRKMKKRIQALAMTGVLAAGIWTACPVLADAEPEMAAPFTIEDINGDEYTEKIFEDADLTMVNVFATWCGPCIREVPELQKLSEEMKEDGVQIIGIVMDTGNVDETDEEAVETARLLAETTGAEYPFLIPDADMMNDRLSDIQAYPETFFVNKDGEIVGETYVGSRDKDEWKEIVEKELKALEKEESSGKDKE